jgi:hypothetical protein
MRIGLNDEQMHVLKQQNLDTVEIRGGKLGEPGPISVKNHLDPTSGERHSKGSLDNSRFFL